MENETVDVAQETEQLNSQPESSEERLYAGKYKTADELEKGYKESSSYITTLRKQIQENKAPEKYDFSNFGEKINTEDALTSAILESFKEADLSQDKANKILETYFQGVESMKVDPEEEKKKLGVNADEILNKLDSFSEKLNDKDKMILASLSDTAEGVDFLYRYIIGSNPTIPVSVGDTTQPLKSGKELIAEAMAYKKEHENSIGFDRDKQSHYNNLLEEGIRLQNLGK